MGGRAFKSSDGTDSVIPSTTDAEVCDPVGELTLVVAGSGIGPVNFEAVILAVSASLRHLLSKAVVCSRNAGGIEPGFMTQRFLCDSSMCKGPIKSQPRARHGQAT